MLHSLVPENAVLMRYYPFVPPNRAALHGKDEHEVILRRIANFLERLGRDLSEIKEDTLPEGLRYRTMDAFLGPMSYWLSTKMELGTAYCTLRGMLDGDKTENDDADPPRPAQVDPGAANFAATGVE